MNKVKENATKSQGKKETVKGANVSNAIEKSGTVEKFDHIQETKNGLKGIIAKYKTLKGELKAKDVEKRKELEKVEEREILNYLKASYQGLFNIVDFLKKTEGGKITSAFAVLSKLPIKEIVNAGFNGRKYSFTQVRKAFKALQADKDNATLNEAHGQRISALINEVHNSNASNKGAIFLQTLIDEKFLNLDKCPEAVAVLCVQHKVTVNERVQDMFNAWQIKQAEIEKNKLVKAALWESYQQGNIEIIEETQQA